MNPIQSWRKSKLFLDPTYRYLRLALTIALALTVIYYLAVVAGAVAIYHYNLDNSYTENMDRIFPYPAAVVDGTIIPLSRYQKEVRALEFARTKEKTGATDQSLKQSVMERLTSNVLFENVLTQNNLSVTDQDTNTFLATQAQQIGGQDKLTAFVQSEYGGNLSYSDFQTITKESLERSLVQKDILVHITLSHILIAVSPTASAADIAAAQQKATTIKATITDPSKFAAAAKQYSEDVATSSNGGSLGTTSRGELAPIYSQAFENAVFALPVGVVSGPIRSTYGWHLVLVTNRAGTIDESLDQYQSQLESVAKIHVFVTE